MKKEEKIFLKFILPSFLFGIIGGCMMIGVTLITTNGPLQILPYLIVMIPAIYIFKRKSSELTFMNSFWFGVIIFMLMSIIFFIYISFLEHSFDFSHSGDIMGILFSLLMAFVSAIASSSLLSVLFFRSWREASKNL